MISLYLVNYFKQNKIIRYNILYLQLVVTQLCQNNNIFMYFYYTLLINLIKQKYLQMSLNNCT